MLTIKLHIVTKDVISLSISVLLLFRHYISHKINFGAPSSGGVLRSACGAFIFRAYRPRDNDYDHMIFLSVNSPDRGPKLTYLILRILV